jgi:hypothetical protein
MKTEQEYRALQTELAVIEQQTGLYLADDNVDRENAQNPDDWDELYYCACMAAGMRAENAGQDINVLIGRTIY